MVVAIVVLGLCVLAAIALAVIAVRFADAKATEASNFRAQAVGAAKDIDTANKSTEALHVKYDELAARLELVEKGAKNASAPVAPGAGDDSLRLISTPVDMSATGSGDPAAGPSGGSPGK